MAPGNSYARILPAELTPTFADRDLRASGQPAPPITCTILFDVSDARTSPDMAGVIGKRAVLAPKDSAAWLRAVVAGFSARGIAPLFAGDSADGAMPPLAHLTLKTAWIDSSVNTFNASVVMTLHMQGMADHNYRGRASRTAYWSMGADTAQSAMDGAFANLLDQIAPALQQTCRT